MPVFARNDDDDFERFFELYKGYIHSIGINLSAVTGNPAGWEKAMGILHACLTGPAARWYDSNILGKRVKLRNILFCAAYGDETAFKALLGNNVNCPANTWVNTDAVAHMTDGADNEFTNDPLNHNVIGDATEASVAIAGGAGVSQPYVIPAYPYHVLIKMRNEFPTQQNARCQLRFGNLFQENMPVRDFYDKVRRSVELLGYGNDILVNQFLRGLNDDCAIEAERIGAERNIEELVGLLERVEKRKAELRLGRERQKNICYQRDRQIILEQLPPVSQEPESLKARDVKPVYKPKPKPKPQYYDDWELYAYNLYPDKGPNPFDEDRNDDMHLQYLFDIATRERREDAELNKAMRELFLDDHDDPMDTSNAIRGVPIELVQEVQEEYLGPMAMDIDVARLENSKNLLAINGNVNGIDIQCLADSCANVSFIQEEAVLELKLKADKSIKHSITGASGPSETLGIVKNVSIELLPGCIIKEDLVILKGYKHREIGLSRACL
ncbi:hypothetical protein RclHR1_37080001, partial [Rhizophagus clarus]